MSAEDGGESAAEAVVCLPVKERKVRDIFFLLLFVLFFLAVIGLLVYVGLKGDLGRLTHGVDRYGNVCGQRNKKILGVENSGKDLTNEPYAEMSQQIAGVTFYNCTAQCSEHFTNIFYRCVSNKVAQVAASVGEMASQLVSSDFLQESVEDLEKCWKEMIYMCLIALGLSLIIVLMLRLLACAIVWLSIALAVVSSIAGTCYLWYQWDKAKKEVDKQSIEFQEHFKGSVTKWLIYAIIATVATVLLLLVLLVMRSRIRLVVALFKEAGKVVSAMPLLLLQPIWTFIILATICAAWTFALMIIESAGTATVYDTNYVIYKKNFLMHFTRWYHLFALFWLTQFCLACQDFVIGSAVTEWYFTRDKSTLNYPILTGLARLLRYHLGSMAIGSLIIAIIKFIRVIFNYLEKKFNTYGEAAWCKVIVCCINCCLKCFENFLRYISRNAYIEIAIFGSSFCEGAKRAFEIISSNALRVAAINSVGDFVLFLCKLAVTVTVIVSGIELIKLNGEVQHNWVPISLCALFAMLISHCFLSVYEMTIDTILVCFCEDCDINDGVTKPYYMDSTLMEFVENSRRQLAMATNNNHKVKPDTSPPHS